MPSRSKSFKEGLEFICENKKELFEKYDSKFIRIKNKEIVNVSSKCNLFSFSLFFKNSWNFLVVNKNESNEIKAQSYLNFWSCVCEPYRRGNSPADISLADKWLYINGYNEKYISILRIIVFTSLFWHAYNKDEMIHRVDIVLGWFILPSLLLTLAYFAIWITDDFWQSLQHFIIPVIVMVALFSIVIYILKMVESIVTLDAKKNLEIGLGELQT